MLSSCFHCRSLAEAARAGDTRRLTTLPSSTAAAVATTISGSFGSVIAVESLSFWMWFTTTITTTRNALNGYTTPILIKRTLTIGTRAILRTTQISTLPWGPNDEGKAATSITCRRHGLHDIGK